MSRFFECPQCGAQVKVGAKVCRECGSDDNTGWQSSEEIDYQSLDIPDGYGPDDESTPSNGSKAWIPITALVVALAMIAWVLRGLF